MHSPPPAIAACALRFGALWLALALVCYALAGAAGFTLSGLAWLAAFGLALAYLGPVFLGPRPDAGQGCEEPLDARGEEPPARCG